MDDIQKTIINVLHNYKYEFGGQLENGDYFMQFVDDNEKIDYRTLCAMITIKPNKFVIEQYDAGGVVLLKKTIKTFDELCKLLKNL